MTSITLTETGVVVLAKSNLVSSALTTWRDINRAVKESFTENSVVMAMLKETKNAMMASLSQQLEMGAIDARLSQGSIAEPQIRTIVEAFQFAAEYLHDS